MSGMMIAFILAKLLINAGFSVLAGIIRIIGVAGFLFISVLLYFFSDGGTVFSYRLTDVTK